jgi:hypothetical protein
VFAPMSRGCVFLFVVDRPLGAGVPQILLRLLDRGFGLADLADRPLVLTGFGFNQIELYPPFVIEAVEAALGLGIRLAAIAYFGGGGFGNLFVCGTLRVFGIGTVGLRWGLNFGFEARLDLID